LLLTVSAIELVPFNRSFQVYLTATSIESMYPDAPQLRAMAGEGRVFPGGNELIPLCIKSVYGYHAAKPAATDRLITIVRSFSPWVLRQTAMTAYASSEGAANWEQFRPVLAEGLTDYPENPMPRAFIPESVIEGSVDDGFEAVENGANPQETTIVLNAPGARSGTTGTAEIQIDLPELVQVKTVASQNGFLILADSWYPEWKVTVDGEQAILYRANGWMRGVEIPSGEHTVVFSYSSRNVVTGGIVSLAAALLVLLLFLYSAARRKRSNA
jgi:hypothetical protein